MRKIITTFFLIILSAQSALAECSGNFCDVKIESFYISSTWVAINTDGTESNLNCTPFEGKSIRLHQSHTNYNTIYATLLSIKLADKRVKIRIHEGSTDCSLFYIVMP